MGVGSKRHTGLAFWVPSASFGGNSHLVPAAPSVGVAARTTLSYASFVAATTSLSAIFLASHLL